MCDYSLHAVQNRLAVEGEQLVVRRFQTGSIGLSSPPPVITGDAKQEHTGFWRKFFNIGLKPSTPECAVCVPPGAQLRVHDIPRLIQRDFGIGESEDVTFTQLTARENTYRDAIRFKQGPAVLLQHLTPGQRVEVLNLAGSEAEEPIPELLELEI
ncbi:MAG TPA: hypothetical protein VMG40_06070 [Bryobacteraceae bacterium]|nr:hypothetical protein [Bryobacteraceae bacterium]